MILPILWLLLAALNFIIQLAYFRYDDNRLLFSLKKITTPLLLFLGLLIVVLRHHAFPPVPCAILLAMGLGEIGIEGSSVVEKHEGEDAGAGDSIVVLLAGVLFLLVNVFIGGWLVATSHARLNIPAVFVAAVVIIGLMLLLSFRGFKPGPGIRMQMIIYSAGLVILLAGVLADSAGGLSRLGFAGAVLTVSDSLVLIRMGAGFDKQRLPERRILLGFLVVILLLYYLYMWLLLTII